MTVGYFLPYTLRDRPVNLNGVGGGGYGLGKKYSESTLCLKKLVFLEKNNAVTSCPKYDI